MNILLTCAGRRNYLVRFFKEALGTRGHIVACDASSAAPAFVEADKSCVVPAMDRADYVDALTAICREHRIRLIVSVYDLELAALARHALRFRALGAIPVVAAPQVIETCQDKWAAFQWLRARGIQTPATCATLTDARQALADGAWRFPLLIKPRWGTSSAGIERVDNERELELAYEWAQIAVRRSNFANLSAVDPKRTVLIQEWVPGQEYGIDVVNDLEGNYVTTFARRKLVMRAGNTDRAITIVEPKLERLGKELGQQLGHIGCVDCDVIETEAGFCVLDLNPRLGGGYPFSHLAGANLPAALIAWTNGETVNPEWLNPCPGVLSSKFDDIVTMNQPQPLLVNQSTINGAALRVNQPTENRCSI